MEIDNRPWIRLSKADKYISKKLGRTVSHMTPYNWADFGVWKNRGTAYAYKMKLTTFLNGGKRVVYPAHIDEFIRNLDS